MTKQQGNASSHLHRDCKLSDEFVIIDQKVQNQFWGVDEPPKASQQSSQAAAKQEEVKVVELSPKEKAIKEELKEESLELLWKLCQELTVVQGLNFAVHKGAVDAFVYALNYNSNEVKWRYVAKAMEKLQQNESIISVCSVLKKFLQLLPEGDIAKIRNPPPPPQEESLEEVPFPKTRIELISKLDKDYSLMNELMSLHIEFKRNTLDLIYDHLGRNIDREQSLETQTSLSSQSEAEGEDTDEDEEVQTDAASRLSQNDSNNCNEEMQENDENDFDLKSRSKPQALSEDDGFNVPKNRRISNNEDEEHKDKNKREANQSLTITDISMVDEDNKDKALDKRYISKRSHSARDNKNRPGIHSGPAQNHRENDFLLNVETNAVYEMKYFKEVGERLEFLKFVLK